MSGGVNMVYIVWIVMFIIFLSSGFTIFGSIIFGSICTLLALLILGLCFGSKEKRSELNKVLTTIARIVHMFK